MAAVGTLAEPSTGTTTSSSTSPSLLSQQPSFGLQPPPMSPHPSSAYSSSSSFSTLTGFDDDKYPSSVRPQVRPPVVAYPLTAKRYVGRGDDSGPIIQKPPYADTGIVPPSRYHDTVLIHNDPDDIDRMRYAARLARKVLDMACNMAEPGMTTDVIDEAVHRSLIEAGAYPSPLNYVGFPKSVCSSVNEVICHGIPDTRPLEFGDVVSFDVSCFVNGVHGDNCATVIVGDQQELDVVGTDWRGVPYLEPGSSKFSSVEEEAMVRASRRLVHATRESMMAAIHCIGPGKCLSHIGAAIQDVADAYGYSTVEKYRGHGISSEFHIAPFVKHFRNNDKLQLVPGMIFTIEPMLVEGDGECFEWSDQWTVASVDGGMAAQFEHTILITDDGVEILTIPESEY